MPWESADKRESRGVDGEERPPGRHRVVREDTGAAGHERRETRVGRLNGLEHIQKSAVTRFAKTDTLPFQMKAARVDKER